MSCMALPTDPDDIEREPPNWGVLPIAAIAVIVIFFILIPWLLLKFSR